jgi:hypothetical protein
MNNQANTFKSVLAQYAQGPTLLEQALSGLTDTDLDLTLSEDSWSIRQIVHHIADGDDIWKICIISVFDVVELHVRQLTKHIESLQTIRWAQGK